jgi:hypothetical protein
MHACISREILKSLADIGLFVMTAPQEHSEPGADWVTACVAAEELGYADVSIALPVFWLVESSWRFVVDRHCSEEVREAVISFSCLCSVFNKSTIIEKEETVNISSQTTIIAGKNARKHRPLKTTNKRSLRSQIRN